MILNLGPLKGALFGSVVALKEDFESLSGIGGPDMAAFYWDEGVVLFSPSFRKIWPDIGLGASLDQLLSYVAPMVVPAEKHLFSRFGDSLKRDEGDRSGIFLLQTHRLSGISVLGLAFFRYSWGGLTIVLPGSEPGPVKIALSALKSARSHTAFDSLDRWVKDSENEFVLTWILENLPEEFRNEGRFERTMVVPDPGKRLRTLRIFYHYRGRKWDREVIDGSNGHFDSEDHSKKSQGEGSRINGNAGPIVRGKGTRQGNEILIHFTTFMGGVLPLGDLSLPAQILSKEGMKRVNRFFREVSRGTLLRSRSLKSDSFQFTRYWDDNAFRPEGLEEIARLIDPSGWKKCMVLPFWMTHSESLSEILSVSRVSDPLFVDHHRNMGVILLRNCCGEDARKVVYENFRSRTKSHVEHPVSIAEFLEDS